MRVLGFGDVVIDRFLDRGIDYPGGNCVNFAVFSQQLGTHAAFMGVFGSDDEARFVRSELAAMGIDLSHSVVREGETGIATVEVINGERVFRGGNAGGITVRDPITVTAADVDYLDTFSLVHSSVYSATESQMATISDRGILTSYDFSSEEEFRSAEYLDLAEHIDLALFSCSDLSPTRTDALLRSVVGRGAGMALGTRGSKGSMLFVGGEMIYAEAVPLDPHRSIADTMGCGDALLAAFATSALRSGWTKQSVPSIDACHSALMTASRFAADQCYVDGAFGHGRRTPSSSLPSSPSRVEVG